MAIIYKRGSLYLQLESASINVTSQHEMVGGGYAICFFHALYHAVAGETPHIHPASNAFHALYHAVTGETPHIHPASNASLYA